MSRFMLWLIVLFSITGFAQQNPRLDSLLNISKHNKGRELVNTYSEISWEYKNSNTDSALVYAKKSLKIAESIKDKQAVAAAYNTIASGYEASSQLDSALTYHQKSLDLKLQIKDTLGIANSLNNLGIIYDTKGNYAKALENYFEALKIYEVHATEFDKVPMVFVNIGIVYKKQKEFKKVLDYYKKALDIYKKNNYVVGETIITGNIGSVLLTAGQYNEAIRYALRAEKMYDSLGYSRYKPYMRLNMAVAKDSLKQYSEAKADYITAITAFSKDNNLYELTNAKVSYANNRSINKNYIEAKNQLSEALKIAKDNGYKELEIKALKYLAEVVAKTGNYQNAFNYLKNYTVQKDSVFETDKIKIIFELEAQYETEKKEKEILSQRADLVEQKLDISKKNNYILGLSALAVLLVLFVYLVYSRQKLKNRQLQKESELKDALLKIETQSELQEQRLRISRDLHDNIGAQLTFIISSLDNLKYGFKLPEKLGEKLKAITEFTTTTIYELRDTIWAMNTNEISFEDLQIRISNYIDKANLAAQNIEFQFKVDESINSELGFTSVQGMTMYRIIQEGIHNALKYAEASKIEVVITKAYRQILITISDNGKGFDINQVKLGNGIQNMKKRASDINGVLDINSSINQGTIITLKV